MIQARTKPDSSHCTRTWGLGQVVQWGTMPLTGLTEKSLARRSEIRKIAQVFAPELIPGEVDDQPNYGPDGRFVWSAALAG